MRKDQVKLHPRFRALHTEQIACLFCGRRATWLVERNLAGGHRESLPLCDLHRAELGEDGLRALDRPPPVALVV